MKERKIIKNKYLLLLVANGIIEYKKERKERKEWDVKEVMKK